jgi:hypothetical protein
MTVRIGHPPTRNEAFAFIAVHVAAAVLVLALPGRFVRAVGRRLRPTGPTTMKRATEAAERAAPASAGRG